MRVVIIFILACTPLCIISQANFLDKGDSGGMAAVGFFIGDDQTDLLLGGGFSPNGLFEFSAFVQRGTLDEDIQLRNTSLIALVASARYFIIKQDDLPIQLSFGLFGGLGKVNSDEISALNWDVRSRHIGLGTNLYYNFESDSNINFQPFAGVSYSIQEVILDTNGLGNSKDDATDIKFTLGGSLILDLDANRFVISPEIIIGDDYNRFGLSLLYLLD